MHDLKAKLQSFFDFPSRVGEAELAEIIWSLRESLRPVWHPLGFMHVKLLDVSSGETFRLHLWSAEMRHPEEQSHKVHDHLFDVYSRVVFGAVENRVYKFTDSPGGEWREARVQYGDGRTSLLSTDVLGSLHKISSHVYMAPDVYHVPRHELHETSLYGAANALTLVRTCRASEYMPRAIFKRNALLPNPRAPVSIDRDVWFEVLRELISV